MCAYMRDNERETGGEGRQRRGWTVQYTPDKGQRDVLFMIQAAAAAAEAARPRLK